MAPALLACSGLHAPMGACRQAAGYSDHGGGSNGRERKKERERDYGRDEGEEGREREREKESTRERDEGEGG